MTRCVALIRGINVGRAKRIRMPDLQRFMEDLGFSGVRTLLNSGNVIFSSPHSNVRKAAASIEEAIATRAGFAAPVIVITARELSDIIAENPLLPLATDPSRHLVAFAATPETLAKARALLAGSWAPDALAVGRNAAYLWCAGGILESKLMQTFARATGEAVTTRNWATVLKLQAAAGGNRSAG